MPPKRGLSAKKRTPSPSAGAERGSPKSAEPPKEPTPAPSPRQSTRLSPRGGPLPAGATAAASPTFVLEKESSPSTSDTIRGSRPGSGHSMYSSNADPMYLPTNKHLLRAKQLQVIADQLAHSLTALRSTLAEKEARITSSRGRAVLPFQIRRVEKEKEQLEIEIRQTTRTIRTLLLMSNQMEEMMNRKRELEANTRTELEAQIAALEQEKAENDVRIRDGYVQRIGMLRRYWQWRQLRELGDTSVGVSFKVELARGPRFRNVGIQNNIQSDYMARQLQWLETFAAREGNFLQQLKKLDGLIEDLADIGELMEGTLTCAVCGLLYDEPVLMWPCGHTFCCICFDSLAIAPSLFRCPTCGSIGSEGFVHNLLLAETVAKWMFKDAGYDDLQGPVNSIRLHLGRFNHDEVRERVNELKEALSRQRTGENSSQNTSRGEDLITVTYRPY